MIRDAGCLCNRPAGVTFVEIADRRVVWSCYQEEPVEFEGKQVYDIGAYPQPPLSGRITSRVMEPWKQSQSEQERQAAKKMWEWVERVKRKQQEGK